MKKNEDFLFKAAVIFAGYFIILKPILNKLGITKSEKEKAIITETENPNSAFNKTFWRTYFYQGGVAPNGRKPITAAMLAKATKNAKNVYNSFGYFVDDEARIKAAFKNCISKSDVSLLSFEFSRLYNTDLLKYLSEGIGILPQNGLSDQDIIEIVNFVNKLKNA